MSNEIVKHETVSIIRTMDDAERAAKAMAASGFFADSKQANQAVVKILAGQELGFGPFASMTGVNIIQNKPVLAANLMAAAVKRGGKYNYRILTMTNEVCELEFFELGQAVGKSRFDMKDAKAAGLDSKDNWKKFPRNMLFARALSNGQKWYAPDVFNGATVYTPDELGAVVDEDGNAVVTPSATEETPAADEGKLQAGWAKWNELTVRARKVKVPVPVIDPEIKLDDLRAEYTQLLAFVKDAEEQMEAEKAPAS